MQGIVFTYRKKKPCDKKQFSFKKREFRDFLKKWGNIMLFALMLVVGLGVGCICSGNLSSDTLKNLDFLFTTNMPERLSGGALNAFCASFASDFLFLLSGFLMGMCLWGVAALPFIAFFKGFGIGVSAGYLLMTYGFKGILFYLFVLLPGIIIFSLALIYELSSAYYMFKRFCFMITGKTKRAFKEFFINYLKSALKYLAITFAAAVLDTVLWMLLANLFF